MTVPTILVIDDNPASQTILAEALRAAEMEVHLAESAVEGTPVAASLLPDVIVLDFALADAGGLALCRQWRGDPTLGEIPVESTYPLYVRERGWSTPGYEMYLLVLVLIPAAFIMATFSSRKVYRMRVKSRRR